jgi:PTS system cellobiose-specific IIB component
MKILLVCYGGLSTGIMKKKIEEAAAADGVNDLDIHATAYAQAIEDVGDYDIYLLGPQIRYAQNDFEKKAEGRPVLVISPSDFGMMNGAKVWQQIQAAMK